MARAARVERGLHRFLLFFSSPHVSCFISSHETYDGRVDGSDRVHNLLKHIKGIDPGEHQRECKLG